MIAISCLSCPDKWAAVDLPNVSKVEDRHTKATNHRGFSEKAA